MNKRKIGNKSEKRAAKKVGAKVVHGSGSLWYNKGDYETNKILYQNKFSGSGSYQLKISDLIKAEKDGLTKNKDFIFSIEVEGEFVYCFQRILISEKQEDLLNLISICVNKCVVVDKTSHYLVNEKYIIIHEYYFSKLKLGDKDE